MDAYVRLVTPLNQTENNTQDIGVLNEQQATNTTAITDLDTLYAWNYCGGSTSIVVGYNNLVFNSKKYEEGDAINSSYRLDPQVDGWYQIDVTLKYEQATWSAGNRTYMMLYVNGVHYDYLDLNEIQASGTWYYTVHGSISLKLLASDSNVYIRIYTDKAVNLRPASFWSGFLVRKL